MIDFQWIAYGLIAVGVVVGLGALARNLPKTTKATTNPKSDHGLSELAAWLVENNHADDSPEALAWEQLANAVRREVIKWPTDRPS